MVGDRGVQLKTPAQVVKMRAAGLVVAGTLQRLTDAARPGVTTAELDELAEDSIRSAGAIPSFKGYGVPPFPASICASVNEQIVHGIPGSTVLRDGDIVSIDCGAIVDGWHGDAAVTVAVGAVDESRTTLIRDTEAALWAGISAMRDGGWLRDVGSAIEESAVAAGDYGIVEEYTGHGIGTEMHQAPDVHNYRVRSKGIRLRTGVVLAIEPMLNLGGAETELMADEWTVRTADGLPSAHSEHTVAITPDGPWVLTALDGGAERLARLGVPCPGPDGPASWR